MPSGWPLAEQGSMMSFLLPAPMIEKFWPEAVMTPLGLMVTFVVMPTVGFIGLVLWPALLGKPPWFLPQASLPLVILHSTASAMFSVAVSLSVTYKVLPSLKVTPNLNGLSDASEAGRAATLNGVLVFCEHGQSVSQATYPMARAKMATTLLYSILSTGVK